MAALSHSSRFSFFANDFTIQQLQSIFDAYKLHISWKNADGQLVEETIPIGDFFEDKR